VIRFDGPPAEGQPEPESAAISASLLEGAKQIVDVSSRKSAALILHFDEDPLRARTNSQCDSRLRLREFECVLKQVGDRCREELSIPINKQPVFNRRHRQANPTCFGGQHGGLPDLVDERRDDDVLTVANSGGQTDLGERPHPNFPACASVPGTGTR